MLLPTETDAPRVLGMVKAAFAPAGRFDELQDSVLGGIASTLYDRDLDAFRRGYLATVRLFPGAD